MLLFLGIEKNDCDLITRQIPSMSTIYHEIDILWQGKMLRYIGGKNTWTDHKWKG